MNKIDVDSQSFIDNVIIPFCMGSVDLDDSFIVHGADGRVIIASNKLAQSIGFDDWQAIRGKTDAELNLAPDNESIHDDWDNLRNMVMREERAVYYINFLNYSYGFDAHANFIFPLFMPNGKVVATRVVVKKFNWLNPISCFNRLRNDPLTESQVVPTIHDMFNEREYNIVFALYIGLTQHEASIFLNISRSNIAKILNQHIYHKLGVEEKNIHNLVNKLNQYKVITYIPKNFMCSKCLIIEDQDLSILANGGLNV